MATEIPEKLKSADVARFFRRANQLQTVKPVISYWCEYWIVNQIIAKGLHNADAECLQFTTSLMDKLEKTKTENANNDAIVDDMAGQAYVEQFGLETFVRAQRAVEANKVTKQTADTFQAAATFLELINIWTPPDAETQSKIKYAKWNAVRIAKAIKEGKDPNETNPKTEPAKEDEIPVVDMISPQIQREEGSNQQLQPSVQDALDDGVNAKHEPSLPPAHEPSPPEAFDPYPRDGFPYSAIQDTNVSPLEPSPKDRNGSIGGGYFPEVPTFTADAPGATLPTAAPEDTMDLGLPDTSSLPPAGSAGGSVAGFASGEAPPTPHESTPQPPPSSFQAPFQSPTLHQPQPPPNPLQAVHPAPPPQQPPPPTNISQASHQVNRPLITDDMAIAKAQKHARWAISALNFEDVPTAVRELREALKTLGAD